MEKGKASIEDFLCLMLEGFDLAAGVGGEGSAYFILITLGGGGGVVPREGRLLGTAYLVLTLAHKCV